MCVFKRLAHNGLANYRALLPGGVGACLRTHLRVHTWGAGRDGTAQAKVVEEPTKKDAQQGTAPPTAKGVGGRFWQAVGSSRAVWRPLVNFAAATPNTTWRAQRCPCRRMQVHHLHLRSKTCTFCSRPWLNGVAGVNAAHTRSETCAVLLPAANLRLAEWAVAFVWI